jgi:hypothetical protein
MSSFIIGNNLNDLLFHFLDEALFIFNGDEFVIRHIEITTFDIANYRIDASW